MTKYEVECESHEFKALGGEDLIDHIENLGPNDIEILIVFQKAIAHKVLDTHTDVWLSEIYVKTEEDNGVEYRHNGLGQSVLMKFEEQFRNKGKRRVVGLMVAEYGYDRKLEKWYVDKMGYKVQQIGAYKYIYKDL